MSFATGKGTAMPANVNQETWMSLDRLLDRKRRRKLCYATYASRSDCKGDEEITIRYHNHPIIRYYPYPLVALDHCGWPTATTKWRMSRMTGLGLYQKNGVWFIDALPYENKHYYELVWCNREWDELEQLRGSWFVKASRATYSTALREHGKRGDLFRSWNLI